MLLMFLRVMWHCGLMGRGGKGSHIVTARWSETPKSYTWRSVMGGSVGDGKVEGVPLVICGGINKLLKVQAIQTLDELSCMVTGVRVNIDIKIIKHNNIEQVVVWL